MTNRPSLLRRALNRVLKVHAIENLVARLVSWIPADLLTGERHFRKFEDQGFHITPVRFDQPIPDTRELDERVWTMRSELIGIDLAEDCQVELVKTFAREYGAEYRSFPIAPEAGRVGFYFDQQSFRSPDPELLFCMIRTHQPKRIIEIGSGMSTLMAMAACGRNRETGGGGCRITAVDPYPRDSLLDALPEWVELVRERVETVAPERFLDLEADDILFIDSSHVVRTGGDVVFELLEVLPRLRSGVVVHVHDVFLPAEYPRSWVMDRHWFLSEQYLLQAFLTFNYRVRVLWAGSYMHLSHPGLLENAFPAYRSDREWPGSFWFRMT